MNYRVVTYDLVNTHAEPHDVAMDPQGNAWVSERAGKLGRLDDKTRSSPKGIRRPVRPQRTAKAGAIRE